MNFQITSQKEKTVYQYTFDSLNELTSYVEEAKINRYCFTNLASNGDNEDFYGTKDFKDALKICRYGILDDGANTFLKLSNQLEIILPNISNERRVIPNFYGIRPNIPNYLHGNPRSMYSLKRFKPKGTIDVYYNVSVPGFLTAQAIMNVGVSTINLVKLLERLGYIVSFNLVSLSHVDNEYTYVLVKIKEDTESIDERVCYFPMCHPSFVRRILFRLKESTPYHSIYNDYGMRVEISNEFVENNLSDVIVIPYSIYSKVKDYDDLSLIFTEMCKKVNLSWYLNGNKIVYDNEEKKLVLRRDDNV